MLTGRVVCAVCVGGGGGGWKGERDGGGGGGGGFGGVYPMCYVVVLLQVASQNISRSTCRMKGS